MQDGNLRVDVNVSLRPTAAAGEAVRDSAAAGGSGRCEIKNLNSLRAIARAVDAEAARHAAALSEGLSVPRETRAYDAASGRTVVLRSKEATLDYRFLPEPDLPPLLLTQEELEHLSAALPELPGGPARRLAAAYGLPAEGAAVRALMGEAGAADFFEAVAAAAPTLDAAGLAAWVTGEMVGAARAIPPAPGAPLVSLASLPPACTAARVAELLTSVATGTLSARQAKTVQAALLAGDARPLPALVADLCGGQQVQDEDALRGMSAAAVAAFPERAAEYRAGRERLLGLFVGEVMARSKGRADPKRVAAMLKELLSRAPHDGPPPTAGE